MNRFNNELFWSYVYSYELISYDQLGHKVGHRRLEFLIKTSYLCTATDLKPLN